jgi:hypothetical protein
MKAPSPLIPSVAEEAGHIRAIALFMRRNSTMEASVTHCCWLWDLRAQSCIDFMKEESVRRGSLISCAMILQVHALSASTTTSPHD